MKSLYAICSQTAGPASPRNIFKVLRDGKLVKHVTTISPRTGAIRVRRRRKDEGGRLVRAWAAGCGDLNNET